MVDGRWSMVDGRWSMVETTETTLSMGEAQPEPLASLQ